MLDRGVGQRCFDRVCLTELLEETEQPLREEIEQRRRDGHRVNTSNSKDQDGNSTLHRDSHRVDTNNKDQDGHRVDTNSKDQDGNSTFT